MNYKVYIDIFSALLTPTIALVTTYIAIQQYRNNRAKLRHELYDRRVAVYNAVGNFLITRINSIEGGGDAFLKFLIAKHESCFLFGNDVVDYLKEIERKEMDTVFFKLILKKRI